MRADSIPYDDFKRFMLQLIERDMKQNKQFCYVAISVLSKSEDLKNKHGTSYIWWFGKLLMERQFADVAVSITSQFTIF